MRHERTSAPRCARYVAGLRASTTQPIVFSPRHRCRHPRRIQPHRADRPAAARNPTAAVLRLLFRQASRSSTRSPISSGSLGHQLLERPHDKHRLNPREWSRDTPPGLPGDGCLTGQGAQHQQRGHRRLQTVITSNRTPNLTPRRDPPGRPIDSRNSRGSAMSCSPSPFRYSRCACSEATPFSK